MKRDLRSRAKASQGAMEGKANLWFMVFSRIFTSFHSAKTFEKDYSEKLKALNPKVCDFVIVY